MRDEIVPEVFILKVNECLQCSLRSAHGASALQEYLILRKDAMKEVLMLLMCGQRWNNNNINNNVWV